MRKQYYFRPSAAGLQAWDVDRLIALTKDLPKREVALEELGELDRTAFVHPPAKAGAI
jgi:hypothetical protein